MYYRFSRIYSTYIFSKSIILYIGVSLCIMQNRWAIKCCTNYFLALPPPKLRDRSPGIGNIWHFLLSLPTPRTPRLEGANPYILFGNDFLNFFFYFTTMNKLLQPHGAYNEVIWLITLKWFFSLAIKNIIDILTYYIAVVHCTKEHRNTSVQKTRETSNQ